MAITSRIISSLDSYIHPNRFTHLQEQQKPSSFPCPPKPINFQKPKQANLRTKSAVSAYRPYSAAHPQRVNELFVSAANLQKQGCLLTNNLCYFHQLQRINKLTQISFGNAPNAAARRFPCSPSAEARKELSRPSYGCLSNIYAICTTANRPVRSLIAMQGLIEPLLPQRKLQDFAKPTHQAPLICSPFALPYAQFGACFALDLRLPAPKPTSDSTIEAQKMQKMRFDYIFIMFKTQLRAKHPGPSENKNAEARFRPVAAKGQAFGRWRMIIMLLRLCV